MTEAEWLACTDPEEMLYSLRGRASDRKLRLFACACCRRIWHLLADERGRHAVEVAERFADGWVGREALDQALRPIEATARPTMPREEWVRGNASIAAWYAAGKSAGRAAVKAPDHASWAVPGSGRTERESQCPLLRDVLGNPFRLVALDPAWLTPDVLALADAAYEERELPQGTLDPARLAVLADALEELGCRDGQILQHLRGPGPHVRGCFGLDLLLGKS